MGQVYNGWEYERDQSGHWVRTRPVGGATGPAPDPTYPLKAPKVASEINKTNSEIHNDAERLKIDRAKLGIDQQQANNQTSANQIAQNEYYAPLIDKQTAIQNLMGVVGDVQKQYNTNFKGAPRGWGGLTESIPGRFNPTNQKFNKRALQAGPFIQSILGLNARDADAVAEYERKVMPFIPEAGNFDGTNENTLKSLWDFIDTQNATIARKQGKIAPPPAYRYDRPPEQYGQDVLQQEMSKRGLNAQQRATAMRLYQARQAARHAGKTSDTTWYGAPRKQPGVIDFNDWGK